MMKYKWVGWLSPRGEFVKCDNMNHYEEAEKIAASLGVNTHKVKNIDDELIYKGWVRFSATTAQGSDGRGFCVEGNDIKFTPEQSRWVVEHINEFAPEVFRIPFKYEKHKLVVNRELL